MAAISSVQRIARAVHPEVAQKGLRPKHVDTQQPFTASHDRLTKKCGVGSLGITAQLLFEKSDLRYLFSNSNCAVTDSLQYKYFNHNELYGECFSLIKEVAEVDKLWTVEFYYKTTIIDVFSFIVFIININSLLCNII